MLAALIAQLGDFDVAEDAFAEAMAAALERWPVDGQPENPAAWLTTTARRKAIDRLRHLKMRGDKVNRDNCFDFYTDSTSVSESGLD